MSDFVYRHPYRRPLPARLILPRVTAAGPVLLSDDFDDNSRDTAKWTLGSIAFENAGVGVAEANQQIEITPLALTADPAIYGYKSVETYDFTSREASIRIAADIDPNTEAWLVVAIDADNYFRTWVASGTLQTRSRVGANNTNESHGTFNFATHTYWRIRHDQTPDQIVWEYSSNGGEWIELRRLARPVTITAISIYISGGTGSSIASPGLVKFDDFNLRTPLAEVFERSTAVSATGSIETAAQFFSVFERASTASATGTISVSGVRVVERSVATSATATIATSAEFFSVLERSAALATTGVISVAGLRIVERAVSVTSTATVAVSAESFSVLERAVAVSATGTVESTAESFSILERQSTLTASAIITTTRQTELSRQSSLNAVGAIAVAGGVVGGVFEYERSAALSATGTIAATGLTTHQRAISISATVTIATSGLTLRERSAALAATGIVTANHQHDLLRDVALTALATIEADGAVEGAGFERSVSLSATATITIDYAAMYPTPPRRTFVVESSQREFKPAPEDRELVVQ